MMDEQTMGNLKEKKLYFLVLAATLLIVFVASGGGLTGTAGGWQHQAFRMLCHQDPARSFWLNGTPMAVCSRCYGIYASFALVWAGIPLAGRFLVQADRIAGTILLVAILLNVVDVIGNLAGFWQNTLPSRFLLGSAVGTTAVMYLGVEFFEPQTNSNKREL